jgi:hypothetical protein
MPLLLPKKEEVSRKEFVTFVTAGPGNRSHGQGQGRESVSKLELFIGYLSVNSPLHGVAIVTARGRSLNSVATRERQQR